jgi:hypothetical protein
VVYFTIILSLILLVVAGLIWLRKAQYDAIHRNFLDLVDQYGGQVARGGFAIRPKYMGKFQDNNVSISFTTEKKNKNESRRYYLSIFLQAAIEENYSILSMDWLAEEGKVDLSRRVVKKIYDKKYVIEVSDKKFMKKLDVKTIEETVEKMHPFAYTLVSKKGILMERLSENLIADTEFKPLNRLLMNMHSLTKINSVSDS